MADAHVTINQLKEYVAQFVHEREWEQLHAPKNLSMALTIEAAELMELFRWVDVKDSHTTATNEYAAIQDEIGDIFYCLLSFATICNIDLDSALKTKMAKNAQRYPVALAKGKGLKYTAYVTQEDL